MATPYSDVFDTFLSKITDYSYINYTNDELESDFNKMLKSACARATSIKEDRLTRDSILQEFISDLTDLEVEILACFMLVEWLNPKINNIELLKQSLSSKDFQMYSQANHLKELQQLRVSARKEASSLMNTYSIKNMKFD